MSEHPVPPGATAPSTVRTSRIHGLDAVRAGALLLGILLHALMPFTIGMPWLVSDTTQATWPLAVISIIHLFRMSLFLVIAGYFANRSRARHGTGAFLRDRGLRVTLPLFVFWPVAVLPLGLIAQAHADATGASLVRPAHDGGLLAAFDLGHLWFLWVLTQCILVAVVARAILVRVANVMGAGLPGGASLMEDYTYDLVEGEERILGAHMLEVSPSLTTARPRLEVHPLGIGGKDDPVRLVFTADPGPAVVVALSDLRERFRLVANVVENVESPELPKLPVGRAVWRPAPDLATSAAYWLTAGAAHHTVMSTAVGIEAFQDFADMTRTELVVIDESTTVRGFADALRWNQAYWRLAQGL